MTETARQTLGDLGVDNVTLRTGDGWDGWPEEAPFDAINVAAAMDADPPRALERQLADGGHMVAPVGGKKQHLVLTVRSGEKFSRQQLEAVQFVPLIRET